MAIKVYCDICGKEIHGLAGIRYFDDFELCEDCHKKLVKFVDDWKSQKRLFFANFTSTKFRAAKKPLKMTELPYIHAEDIKPQARLGKGDAHTHVCKCKGGKPAAVATVKGTPKSHEHRLVTTPELARAIGVKVHTVQCFALRKGLGIFDRKRRAKVFSEADVKVIRAHFGCLNHLSV